MGAFRDAADYYDVLADAAGRIDRERRLLTDCFGRAPGRRVVDLACGTGLHALFFAELGGQVTALDVSAEMIARAEKGRPHASVNYRVSDMREVKGGPWDLAVCLGNSLSLLGGMGEVEEVFRRVSDCLAPGGIWLVQILNYSGGVCRQPRHRIERKAVGAGGEVVAVKSLVPHGDRTLLSLAFFSIESGSVTSVAESAVLLHLDRQQLEEAARGSGFRVEAIYGGFDGADYDAGVSPDLIGVFVKG